MARTVGAVKGGRSHGDDRRMAGGELGLWALDTRRPCAGRSDEASKAALRMRVMRISSIAVGSLVQAIHSV